MFETDAVIHEYRVPFRSGLGNIAELDVYPGRLLDLALLRGQVVLWVAADPTKGPSPMRFQLAGTGAPIHTSWLHLGSVLEGQTAWHVFSESKLIRCSGGLAEPGPRPGPAK